MVLEVRDLHKVYGRGANEVAALRGVDLEIEEGEFVAIVGSSGSGKSTLLNIIGGLDSATSGEVYLNGIEITGCSDEELVMLRRKQIGFVFQFFNLLPQLTAYENVALPLEIDQQKDIHERVVEVLKLVGLEDRMEHYPDQLSGGQKQRVAIARALVTKPNIVLADEPTGNLDSRTSKEILKLFYETSRKHNQTILMITHDLSVAKFADRIITLKDGKILEGVDGNETL
ncbi:ABC transporter ATP-binding protein [Anoxybacter fermentans]|uniref:ABC transporter ATP-binding protein n=1 Tax=Anoxybacter fermentans TaxID=1323375 RepID=A0A3Q9HRR3_9FIRM|nr:ABC transporter ATP-binding protein [Anoxybacter fermentans]AZR74077.1 ABC transporter ATP-binding protein [Anoxybacter fermentans]